MFDGFPYQDNDSHRVGSSMNVLLLTLSFGRDVPVNLLRGAPPVRLAPEGSGLTDWDLAWGELVRPSLPPVLVLGSTLWGCAVSLGGLAKGFASVSRGGGSGLFLLNDIPGRQ